MGHGRHVTGSSYPTPEAPPPVADYSVVLTPEAPGPDPDCRCNYFYTGEHNGKPYYQRQDGVFLLFYSTTFEKYVIKTTFEEGYPCFLSNHELIVPEGTYMSGGGYVGFVTCNVGPH